MNRARKGLSVLRQVRGVLLLEDLDTPARQSSLVSGVAPQSDSVRAVRQGAVLFLVSGLVGLAGDLAFSGMTHHHSTSLILDVVNIALGLVSWSLRDRLDGIGTLVLAVLAFSSVGVNDGLGTIPFGTLGIWFIIIFVWIGAWHSPKVVLAMTLPATLAYLVPFEVGNPAPGGAASSVALIVPVAVMVGVVIAVNARSAQRAQLEQQRALSALAKANITDDLTTLGNRRFGNELLDGVKPGDVLAVLDLDRFKQVNDRFGHATGDRVLQELGEFLTAELSSALVARMGGEEFLVVYRQISTKEAALRLSNMLAKWRSRVPLSTLSAGLALHREDQSPSTTYRLADEALYLAKSRGRDQVAVERRHAMRRDLAAVELER
jgi:diguanylate cyclase (GGDEF)-like protein